MISITEEATNDPGTGRKRLDAVTQATRFSLVQDFLGHPEWLSTLEELDYVNRSRSRTTIRQHLGRLVEAAKTVRESRLTHLMVLPARKIKPNSPLSRVTGLDCSGTSGHRAFRYHRTAAYMDPMTTEAMSASTIPNAR